MTLPPAPAVDPAGGLAVIDLVSGLARVVGLAVLAGAIATAVAAVYRWYARGPVPDGLAVIGGLTVVALYLNATAAFTQIIGGTGGLLELDAVLVNSAAIGAAAGASLLGRRVGDRLAVEVGAITGARELEADVSRLVQSVGRVTAVELPDEIGDIEGYDPVPAEAKAAMAGKTLLFPRRLTVEDLRDRLRGRLRDDYGVGHVDVDLTEDGTVAYLGVGSRAAGIGPTLAPGTAAVAVRADPANSATAGDVVQVWRPGPEPVRIATGELRGLAGEVATIALDEEDAVALDDGERYRLVTLPAAARPEREFAALLREADETMGAIRIAEGSPLAGTPIGDLDVTPVAVRGAGGAVRAIPSRAETLAVGDTLYAMARPEVLRRVEAGTGRDAAPAAGD